MTIFLQLAALVLTAAGLFAAELLQAIRVSDNGRYFLKADGAPACGTDNSRVSPRNRKLFGTETD